MLKDDQQEVRKGGILAATKFVEAVGVDAVNSMIPALKTVTEDNKWRVRLELLRGIADLSIKMNVKYIYNIELRNIF